MIGKNIYELRKKRRMTLSELAKRAEISKSYLSNIERNVNQNPSIGVMRKIALVLNVDLKTLLIGHQQNTYFLEKEWLELVNELKKAGIKKEQIQDYKTLIEFIKWQNTHSESGKKGTS